MDRTLREDASNAPAGAAFPDASFDPNRPGDERTCERARTRVLIVDDEPADGTRLAELVAREGVEIVLASGGKEALDILSGEAIDLVLLDMRMPEVDGLAVLAELRRRGALPALPVIVVTAPEDRDLRIEALDAGAVDFLTTPLVRAEVACRVRGPIERRLLRPQGGEPRGPTLLAEIREAIADLPLALYRTPFAAEAGAPAAARWVVGDLPALTGLTQDDEERLTQARKLDDFGKLAGGVAHDFNNILSVILSFAEVVRERLDESDELRSDVEEIVTATNRAIELTGKLRTFAGQQPSAKKKATDLTGRLADLGKMLRRTVGSQHTLSVASCAPPAVVWIDPDQFDQIVLNLTANAREAMPEGGRLDVALTLLPERRVSLAVTDSGIGMSEEVQRSIFEPRFTTKAPGKGTGMGLAICFGIVKDTGGEIRVASTPGKGTTVTVELPLSSAPLKAARPGADERPARGDNILVVESESSFRRVDGRALEDAGYTVHNATSGKEGLARIDELGPRLDVILADVMMPDVGGYDVAAHAALVAPNSTIILMSRGERPAGGIGEECASWRLLSMPVSSGELVRAVAEALESRAARPTIPVAARPTIEGEVALVIEDDDAVRAVITRALATAGYATVTAATLDAAREFLESNPEPEWVVCGLSSSKGAGAGALDWIQRTHPALCARVLVLNGGESGASDGRLLGAGVFSVLPRTVDPNVLLDVLTGIRRQRPPALAEVAAAHKPRDTAAPRPNSSPPPRGDRVLVVEDDEPLATAMRRILTSAGFETEVASSLAAARRALAGSEFDAMLADVGLPDGSGVDLLRELRGKNSELPVVVITGAPSVESAVQAILGRVSEYLPKPCVAADLLRAVCAAIDAGRVARVRTKLMAARFGGNEFVADMAGTAKCFARALERIHMVFQPIVRSEDGSVFGYEALLRCDEPSLSSPLRLLAAAEVLGRVNDVGHAVRASVAATVRAHQDRVDAIFVNLHPSELRADLLAAAAEPLLPLARRIVLEVTERASLEAGPKLDDDLRILRDRGYRVAVDDLGEGFSGLASLVHLRPEIVKIDMSLVRGVHRAPLKRDIVGALVDMARRSGIVVVAEGIDNVDDRDTLVELGCDLLQGYLFAKPGAAFPVPRTSWEPHEEHP